MVLKELGRNVHFQLLQTTTSQLQHCTGLTLNTSQEKHFFPPDPAIWAKTEMKNKAIPLG